LTRSGFDGYTVRHDIDKVQEGLMVLFFGLVFSVAPLPLGKFSADALA